MNPEQSNQQPTSEPNHHKKRLVLAIVFVLLVAGAAVAAYLNHGSSVKQPKKVYEKGAYNYAYKDLDSFNFKGKDYTTTATFSKPKEYKLAYLATTGDQASFLHTIGTPPINSTVGGLTIATATPTTAITNSYLSQMDKILASPSDPSYKTQVSTLQKFISERVGTIYTLSLDPAQKFRTANITANAWLWDFTAKPTTPKPVSNGSTLAAPVDTKNAKPVPKNSIGTQVPSTYKGQVVMAIGKKTYYYFLVYNTNYNWDNNTAIWSQVTNSLKIDQ